MTTTTVEFVRKSDAVAKLAEVEESEEMLADEVASLKAQLAAQPRTPAILYALTAGFFLLSVVLLAVLFA